MKTPEEIKKGLVEAIEDASCVVEYGDAHDLIYAVEKNHAIMADALAYIQQLEAQVPKWNSVEERIPERYKHVLVATRVTDGDARDTDIAYFSLGGWRKPEGILFGEVTHWMPLPEPPPKEE